MTEFDFPSQTSSRTNFSNGVSSLVEIVMSLTNAFAAFPRPWQYVTVFAPCNPLRWTNE